MSTTRSYQPEQFPPEVIAADDAADAEQEAQIAAAVEVIRSEKRASFSLLQRRLKIGYRTAIRIIDALEARGVIGPSNGFEPRAILNLPEAPGTMDKVK